MTTQSNVYNDLLPIGVFFPMKPMIFEESAIG